jgi:large subunit ribosomal protein L15
MPLYIHTIKPAAGATKKRKRVGRGNASGHGTYSTRGLKGQKSRSGVTNLKRLGMKQMLLRTPKKRGFRSDKPKAQVVNFFLLNKNFKDGDNISPKSLFAKKLIGSASLEVKILSGGNLNLHKLNFKNVKVSSAAKAQIEKSGGQVN